MSDLRKFSDLLPELQVGAVIYYLGNLLEGYEIVELNVPAGGAKLKHHNRLSAWSEWYSVGIGKFTVKSWEIPDEVYG